MAYNGTVLVADACISLRPNGGVSLSGTAAADVVWDAVTLASGEGAPTTAEIETEQARLQAIEDAQTYARNRKAEYDQLNQFEMQFDDKENSTTTWVDKINEIKGRHPK